MEPGVAIMWQNQISVALFILMKALAYDKNWTIAYCELWIFIIQRNVWLKLILNGGDEFFATCK